jgi:cytochrome P450
MTTALDDELQRQGDTWLLELILTPEGIADPAPRYRRLREEVPVFRSSNGVIFLSRFEDCRTLLRDNRFGSGDDDGGRGMLAVDESEELREFRRETREKRRSQGTRSLLFLNPPDHTRLRGLVNRAFTPRRIESMRESITALAEECLDDLAERGEADAIDVLGWLPVNVIGELVGVPRPDWTHFRALVTRGVATLEPGATLEELTSARSAFEEMWAYFRELVAERRRVPADDLISALLEVEEAGDRLTENELISTTILLFSAGMETTQNLIGNGLGALFANPDEQARLWAEPSLVDTAVEEMLRWDSPVQLDGRQALVDADVAGIDVAKGSTVITLLGAANRDPAQFSDPDRFDIGRDEGPPLSFASGIHYCLGANLARAEAQETFAGLIRRFERVEQAGDLVHRSRMTLRGYEAVPIRVTPR